MNFIVLFSVFIVYFYVNFEFMIHNRKKIDKTWEQLSTHLKDKFEVVDKLMKLFKDNEMKVEELVRISNSYILSQNRLSSVNANNKFDEQFKKFSNSIEDSFVPTVDYTNLCYELDKYTKRISSARHLYNNYVKHYNAAIKIFPNNKIAVWLKLNEEKFLNTYASERII